MLEALAARILPSDDGPGAAETGVGGYLQKTLDRLAAGTREIYFQQLDALDQIARRSVDRGFADCSPSDQDRLVESWIEEARARWVLEQLVRISLEGFLGDPRHGGNRRRLGWSYLGLEDEWAPDACLAPVAENLQP